MKIKKIEAVLIFKDSKTCEHKNIESEFSEDEQFAYCLDCSKNLTEEVSNQLEAKYPDYGDLYDQARDEGRL